MYKTISPYHLTSKSYVTILFLVFDTVELSIPQHLKYIPKAN